MDTIDVCCRVDNNAGPQGTPALASALQSGRCMSLQHLDINSEWRTFELRQLFDFDLQTMGAQI